MPKTLELTAHQKEIAKNYALSKKHLAIEARAGCGKSFMLEELVRNHHRGGKVRLCSFNRHNADYLKAKLKDLSHAPVSSVHSWGLFLCKSNVVGLDVDLNKTGKIIKYLDLPKGLDSRQRYDFRRLIQLSKANLVDPRQDTGCQKAVENTCIKYGLNVEENLIEKVCDALTLSLEDKDHVDYDDMIYHPVMLNYNIFKTAAVMVDEAQDLDPAKRRLTLKLGKRVIIVGDPLQSIMGFAGADIHSFANFTKELEDEGGMRTLILPQTFRCPVSHVEAAKLLVPDFLGYKKDAGKISCDFKEVPEIGSLVICRNTAPAVGFALKLIKKGINAKVRGRDIAEDILSFCSSDKYGSVEEMLRGTYKQMEIRLNELNRQEILYCTDLTEIKETIVDSYEVVEELSAGCTSIAEFEHAVTNIFSDSKAPIICSTVHRAKGLESDNVYVLSPEKLSTKNQQEKNCTYVAVTRSKQNLYYQDSLPNFMQPKTDSSSGQQ